MDTSKAAFAFAAGAAAAGVVVYSLLSNSSSKKRLDISASQIKLIYLGVRWRRRPSDIPVVIL